MTGDPEPTPDRPPREPVGRRGELDVIDRWVRMLEGPSALVLHGEAGIGKTTLWIEGVAAARRRSFTVMLCRPAQAESGLPYLGLGDLLSAVPVDALSELPDPQLKSLEIALLIAEAGTTPLQQRAVGVAVTNLLTRTSRSAPILIAIDDAQWLDLPSRRVLRFASRRIAEAAIGFLVATRAGSHDEDVLGLDSIGPERVHHMTIGPLASAEVGHLLRSRLGESISGPLLRRVEQASGGNPLFALELGRALLDSPELDEPGRPLTVPARLTEVLGSRLSRLPKATHEALLVAAALSRPTIELIGAAVGGPSSAVDALIAGVEAGVVELHQGSIRFAHPLLASVLYSQAGAAELRQLHRRLAGLVHEPEERARHLGLSAAARDEQVAAAIAEGARHAGSRGAPDVAAALFEQAAHLTPTDLHEAAAGRTLDAADQHIALGDTARARLLLEDVIGNAPAGTNRARALHRLGRVQGLAGGLEAVSPILHQAIDEVGGDVALRVAIERDLAFIRLQVGDLQGALPHAQAAYDAAMASGRHALVGEALDQLCLTECVAGIEIPAGLLERAIEIDRGTGHPPQADHPGWGGPRFGLAVALKLTDRFDAARAALCSLQTEYMERGEEGSLDTVLFHLGELELWAGDWQAASQHSLAADELASRTGLPQTRRRALLLGALLDEARGDAESARSNGRMCLDLCERVQDVPGVIRCWGLLGRVEHSFRHPTEAVEFLQRAATIESDAGYDPATCRILPDAIDAAIAVGRLPDAEALVERLESYAVRLRRPWAMATAARCRALLNAAGGDLTRAHDDLSSALDTQELWLQPLERARTLLALGAVERRLKKKKDAREALDQALKIFDALGAKAWSRTTHDERDRIGGRAASPYALTSTERRVAELAAAGLTNREVAASMFLSEKTIETNLTRIYEKLEVGSRRQLARKLPQDARSI